MRERHISDFGEGTGKRDIGQGVAIRESTIADGRDGIGNTDRGDAGKLESAVVDDGDGVGNINCVKLVTRGKGTFSNARHRIRNVDRRKNVAGEKQVVADFGNRGGQRDRRQRRAVGKRAIADGCDGIGDGDVGQPAAE